MQQDDCRYKFEVEYDLAAQDQNQLRFQVYFKMALF
jgi:hypothetical protein